MTTAISVVKSLAPQAAPKIGLVLGSGLGALAKKIAPGILIPYRNLPGFVPCSVAGQAGTFHLGRLGELEVACLEGRAHWYEGWSPDAFQAPIALLKELGCETVIILSASGSLRPSIGVGRLVLIKDHINFQFNSPLVGIKNELPDGNARFVGMEGAYDLKWRKVIRALAKKNHIKLTEGVYVGTLGPNFETPAEISAYKRLGAHVVGMSTIPEVILSRYHGLRVVAISAITNKAAGLNRKAPLSHEVTLQGAAAAFEDLSLLTLAFIEYVAHNGTC